MASNMKLSTNKIIALSVVISVIALIILFAIGKSFFTTIKHNTTVINKKTAAETQLKTNLTNLPTLKTAYDNLGGTVATVSDSLPDTADFASLVATMEAVASSSSISLSTVSPQSQLLIPVATPTPTTATTPGAPGATATTTTTTTAPQPTGFSVSVKGSYAAMLVFMGNLEKSSRPIKITDIQLSGTTPTLTGTISGAAYYYNPQVLADKTETVK